MELLIPGLILVALMVYASTRIKKAAAKAYESEIVETDEFVLHKPEGFLNVVSGDPKYAVEIYSKEYGTDGAESARKATATLRIDAGRSVKHILNDRRRSGAATVSDHNEVIDGVRYRVIAAEWNENGIAFTGLRKLAEHRGKVFDLEAKSLAETTGEAAAGIETLIDSFRVK
jgi:hypothetical protein